jgi:hypothetical protein
MENIEVLDEVLNKLVETAMQLGVTRAKLDEAEKRGDLWYNAHNRLEAELDALKAPAGEEGKHEQRV